MSRPSLLMGLGFAVLAVPLVGGGWSSWSCQRLPVGDHLRLSSIPGLKRDCSRFLGIFSSNRVSKTGVTQVFFLPGSMSPGALEAIRDRWGVELGARGYHRQPFYPALGDQVGASFLNDQRRSVNILMRHDDSGRWRITLSVPR